MAARAARLRSAAATDVDDALTTLLHDAGPVVASSFVDAFEQAINHLTRLPNSGSLQFAYDLGIPELRAWNLKRFPYAIFYVVQDDHIDIWRVLHTRRDVPSSF